MLFHLYLITILIPLHMLSTTVIAGRFSVRRVTTLALVIASLGSVARAQSVTTPSGTGSKTGLLIVAHGADSGWNANVRATVSQVQWAHGPVTVAFLMGSEAESASWTSGINALANKGVSRVIAVPLMVSTHGSHVEQIRFYAGEIAALPKELEAMMAQMGHAHTGHMPNAVPVVTTRALDDAPELGDALYERWKGLPDADRRRPLMLVAHGPNDSASAVLWERDILKTSSRLEALVSPHPTRVALLRDDAPAPVRARAVAAMRDTIAALAGRSHDSVTVLPVLISTGDVNRVKIPADIAGLPVRYQPVGLAPTAALARWIERRATERLAEPVVAPLK